MENKELIEKLKKERNEYGIKVNKIDHFLMVAKLVRKIAII